MRGFEIEREMMTSGELRLEHRIARDLGGMTVDELRARMTHREFVEHAAFYKAEAEERAKQAARAKARGRR